MKRKIQPEITKAKILDVAQKLFIDKGYEKTTTQEIVDISGLAKGTVFHHFKTKEYILLGVLEKSMNSSITGLKGWLESFNGLNAREKLIKMFENPDETPEDVQETKLFKMAILTQSPHIHLAEIKTGHEKLAPILAELIREGIKDGSLSTQYPDEVAQYLMLVYSLWCDPITVSCTIPELEQRLKFIQYNMKILGVDIISDKFIDNIIEFSKDLLKEYN